MVHTDFSAWRPSRRIFFQLLASSLLAAILAGCGGGGFGERRVGIWAASAQEFPGTKSFQDQTIRQIAYVSGGGNRVRVRLSNRYGSAPLSLASARIALGTGAAAIDLATDRAVKFAGADGVTVAVGQEIWSDPVDLRIEPHASLAVSMYVADATQVSTIHSLGRQNNYVASGNVASSANLSITQRNQFFAWVTGIDVQSASIGRVVVAFGDSITDGFNSSVDQNHRYPNFLSRVLQAKAPGNYSVVNAGISGNRWIFGGNDNPPGAARFARDVAGQSGVTDTIFLLGINDFGHPSRSGIAAEMVTAEQVFTAIRAAADAAKAKGINVYVGTITPMKIVTIPGYYSEDGEAKRNEVNRLIRAATQFDGIVDFDATLRDPLDPSIIKAEYDSGDHLHPNDAGYEAMANAAAQVLLK